MLTQHKISMQVLRKMIPDRFISHFVDITWPTHSSDLTISYCSLWGYVKSKVYETCPAKLCDLKLQICECIQGIPMEMLQYMTTSPSWKCRGGQLQSVIFKHKWL